MEPIVVHPDGVHRIVVTKELPGTEWQRVLTDADCRIEIFPGADILDQDQLIALIGDQCNGAIGQLTEPWDERVLGHFHSAGGRAYSNYAVGFNNVDVDAATRLGIPIGNTPGVLTEATAELTVALTFAASRRIVESDQYLREGKFKGWLPSLFIGQLLNGKTVGIVGAGRIGSSYARMMVEGHKMNLLYHSPRTNEDLESYVADYSRFLQRHGEPPLGCQRVELDSLLRDADVVSLHCVLNESTHHLINEGRLSLMQEDAILINTSRGPVIDEVALVEHCQSHPGFRVGLDVFENEPALTPGLTGLPNVVTVPHIASATAWSREGMATIAACNVTSVLQGHPVNTDHDILEFLDGIPPRAAPSIVNASSLGGQ